MPADRSTPTARVAALIEPALGAAGFDLEEVAVSRAGRRSVVRVVVGRDTGLDLDAVAEASRAVDAVLEEHEDAVAGEYVLEVTSPGVDRPLTLPRHWRRNTGRLVEVTRREGPPLTGRVTAATDDGATLQPEGGAAVEIAYADVARALVQVEFTRRPGAADGPDVEDDLDDPDDPDDEDEA